MSDEAPSNGFQRELERIEGHYDLAEIPTAVNPLQAQSAFERRALLEDMVAHVIAIIMTAGFFLLAFAALLGFVDITNAAIATFLGTTMGYAVGQFHPILSRYFHRRGGTLPRPEQNTNRLEGDPEHG